MFSYLAFLKNLTLISLYDMVKLVFLAIAFSNSDSKSAKLRDKKIYSFIDFFLLINHIFCITMYILYDTKHFCIFAQNEWLIQLRHVPFSRHRHEKPTRLRRTTPLGREFDRSRRTCRQKRPPFRAPKSRLPSREPEAPAPPTIVGAPTVTTWRRGWTASKPTWESTRGKNRFVAFTVLIAPPGGGACPYTWRPTREKNRTNARDVRIERPEETCWMLTWGRTIRHLLMKINTLLIILILKNIF